MLHQDSLPGIRGVRGRGNEPRDEAKGTEATGECEGSGGQVEDRQRGGREVSKGEREGKREDGKVKSGR